jgi:hypothetical protein
MDQQLAFQFYTLLLGEAGSLRAARREANNFFMTLNVAGLGAIGFLMNEGVDPGILVLLCGTMVIVSYIWWNSISHYAKLSGIKYDIIKNVEDQLPIQPTQEEWRRFTGGKRGQGSNRFEKSVPLLFAIGYAGFAALQVVLQIGLPLPF